METLDTTKTLTGVSYEDTDGTVHQFTLSGGDDSNNVKSVLTGTLGTTTIKNTNTDTEIEAAISVMNGTEETTTGVASVSTTVSDNQNKVGIEAMNTSGGFVSSIYTDDGSVLTTSNVADANKGIEQTVSFTDTVTNTTYSTELNQYATGVKYSKSTDDSTMPESDKEVARKGDLKGQIKTENYDNTTLADHITEILGYVNTENGGSLLGISLKIGTTAISGEMKTVTNTLSTNTLTNSSSTVNIVNAGEMLYLTVAGIRNGSTSGKKVTFITSNDMNTCSFANIDLSNINGTNVATISGQEFDFGTGTILTNYFKGIDILNVQLEHLTINHFTV